MFMTTAALVQPLHWEQKREDEYLRRIGQYDAKTQALFPRMFGEIVLTLEQEGMTDVLGEMFMELELMTHWKGQFFTPEPVCRMMAEMQAMDAAELIEQQGFITVNEPTCGAGAMLIAFAHACHKQDIDFQRNVLFVGQDVDPVVARMCYIQMSLLGMSGYVIIGDSLLYPPTGKMHPECEYLFTPLYYLHGFQWRKQRGFVEDEPVGVLLLEE
ncbi:MAG: SAM-dependent methyltransferase [Defluviitaleaceae bacterium]|nr:SAM-dependent methyltransferase [Defluviitaleaceae bacterium]